MAFIDIIEPEDATGELREIYDKLEKQRGKLAQVHKIQSLNPPTITAHMDLYMSVMFSQSPLDRAQREMMAVVVSAANKCDYCQQHHGEALNHYWRDRGRIKQLQDDYRKLDLDNVNARLCQLAQVLTRHPGGVDKDRHLQPLKNTGLSDRAILDAVLVISYFNFVNRMVLGLGVETNEEEMQGYKY
ncbi:peroxidase-related enzyme [Fodinibius sediminis]|uniref:Uncharacterized peroxidase-related enzyme n=1 Tax=Fodinibius sediminis TaxID=1214077 RepID=A0A521CMS7_9BACT|nr:peroxidase-related enzyme [Fodinibius sediminis]SMO60061.1 uncharacterized peroxidase-related enzyme [Fodinibius sediminis]